MNSLKPVSANTRLCVVLGDPIQHSLSPLIHNHWYKKHDLDAVYLALPVKTGCVEQVLNTLAVVGALGANITVPHKIEALKACRRLTIDAQRTGAVNTVLFGESTITGDNTDAQGLTQDLHLRAPPESSFAKACLWGAGGAAQAVLIVLERLGTKEVLIINRTRERVENLVRSFNANRNYLQKEKEPMALQSARSWSEREDFISTSDVFINASAQGMTGITADESFFPDFVSVVKGDPSCKLAYDLVYNPQQTLFLQSARKANIKTLDGMGMLVRQAAVSFEKWFGIVPDVSDALLREMAAALGRD